jgi:hypothetical protein
MIPTIVLSFVMIVSMVSGWPSSSRSVTVSPHTYSTEAECDAAVSVLKAGKVYDGKCIPGPTASAPQADPAAVAAPVAAETAPVSVAPKRPAKAKAGAKAAPAPVLKAPVKAHSIWPWG